MPQTANKIPKGYKQTEVGVIPEDWDVKEFGEIVHYIKGFAFKSKDYKSDGIRIIRVSDTTYDSIKKENAIYIDEKRINEFRNWKLDEYDLIFSTVGSKPPMYDSLVGKVIIIKKEFAGSFLNQNAVLIRAKEKNRFKDWKY
ncbi:MAG: Restriction modification system DNA specificity protein [uncultured bacterium]|nr:MAG: Restriction modification system DNA specificity protein [uncultured bacterium]